MTCSAGSREITDYDSYFIEKFKLQESEQYLIDSKTHYIVPAPLDVI
jgi:hypothetical protein